MRRGSPELVDALHGGLISARTADSLFYLPLEEQRTQLERRLQVAQERARRSLAAAQAIRAYLDAHQQVELEELKCRIGEALLLLPEDRS
jgi:hypothetical protein